MNMAFPAEEKIQLQKMGRNKMTSKSSYMKTITMIASVMHLLCSVPDCAAETVESSAELFHRDDHAWRNLNGPWGGGSSGFCIDRSDHNHIVMGTWAGAFASYNAGATWLPSREGMSLDTVNLRHIRQHPFDPDIYYAAGGGWCSVYKSVDGGQVWEELSLTDDLLDVWIHGSNPDRVLAGGFDRLYISEDGGESWSILDVTHDYYEFTDHPANPDIIYAAIEQSGTGVSTDGGLTWEIRGHTDSSKGPMERTEASHRSIEVLDDEYSAIYTAWRWNFEGNISKSTDGGYTWELLLDETINCIRADPSNSDVLWAVGGTYDWFPTLIYRSSDGGETWESKENEFIGMGLSVTVHPDDPQTIYVCNIYTGPLASIDGGETWKLSARYFSGNWVTGLELHPQDEDTLLVAGREVKALFRTDNKGLEWTDTECPSTSFSAWSAYKPDDPQILLAGTSSLHRSTDGGNS